MAEVACLGELLIDFVSEVAGVTLGRSERFVKAAGGAPANVAVGLARLGTTASFVGKVGDDPFGRWLVEVLADEGVDVAQVRYDADARTALAFVSLTSDGEREFTFYRHPSADQRHAPHELDAEALARARVLHHGSISLIQEPSRSATYAAIDVVARAGGRISYDPNLRLPLWPDPETAKREILTAWPRAHLIKISDEELRFLTGDATSAAARSLIHDELDLLLVTRGRDGVEWHRRDAWGHVGGFSVPVVDTTGAGDAFVAAVLSAWTHDASLALDVDRLERALRRANAFAALTTTRKGAIPALPSLAELDAFLGQHVP